jgi:hypothetical protein
VKRLMPAALWYTASVLKRLDDSAKVFVSASPETYSKSSQREIGAPISACKKRTTIMHLRIHACSRMRWIISSFQEPEWERIQSAGA